MATNMTSENSTVGKFKYKVVFLGDQSVGKTSIIHRFIYDSFDENYQATIGIDFMSHKMYVEDKIIILNLWDTAGQERFKSLIPSYIKDSAVAIVVYDITSRQSFQSVDKWIEDAKNLRDDDVLLILAGNKSDLNDQRQVSTAEAQEYATKRGILFFEVSARQGTNIALAFNEVAKKLTGIETNPISQSEIKSTGFTLNQGVANPNDPKGDKGQKTKGKRKACNC